MTGSLDLTKRTVIRCESKTSANFSVQMLTMERITFINCGIKLVSIESTLIVNCTFQDCTSGAISSDTNVLIDTLIGAAILYGSTGKASITGCTFQNNSASDGGGVMLYGSTGNVSITDCTFQSNSAGGYGYGGGAVMLQRSTGDVSITGCTFQSNSAGRYGYSGGAVMLQQSTGDVSITGCTFQSNSALNGGGAVMLNESPGDVSISGCTFQSNSARGGYGDGGGAVILQQSTGDVSITGCTFQSNSAGSGGAVVLYRSPGNVSITGCTFQSNSALNGGGAVMLNGSQGDVSITGCTFQSNSASGGYGDGGGVMLYGSTGNVSITGCTFQGNSAKGSGGAVVLHGSTGDVSITGCTFQNSANGYGGAVELGGQIGNVTITDCTFHMNRGYEGGAISFQQFLLYNEGIFYNVFRNVSITKNIAEAGAAIYAGDSNEGIIQLTLQDVVVKNNHCSSGTCAGAIYFKGVKMDLLGSPTTGSHFSYNSPQGAIQGEGGIVTLHGYVTFDHNTGVNGGAISLSNNVPLYLYSNSIVHLSNNIATGYGGAIYSNGKQNVYNRLYDPTCILLLHYTISASSITFIDNHALQGGHAVYARPIYNCGGSFSEASSHLLLPIDLMSFFNITPLPGDINDAQVLSFPENVNYCGCSDPNLCNGTSPYLTT